MTTSTDRTVFIVSTALDLETDAVVRLLHLRGIRCIRFNSESFPFEQNITWSYLDSGQVLMLEGQDLRPFSVWLRKLRGPAQPTAMDKGTYDFCRGEAYRTIVGALLTIKDCRFMSPPDRIWSAENKILQIAVARKLGFNVPQTVVTNRPQAVIEAYKLFSGKMICKPVNSGFVDDAASGMAIYTSKVLQEHLAAVESVQVCPSIYQAMLDKAYDIRVVWVGGHILAASIDSQSDPAAIVDWRATKNPHLRHNKVELPASLAERIGRFMAELGLSYGALDFVLTKEGEWVFLEVNPNGQWLWLDDFLSLGISETVANWLSGVTS